MPLPKTTATAPPSKANKAQQEDPKAEASEEAPQGAELGHEAPQALHEPRRPSGWRIWGTFEEAVECL